MSLYFFFFSSRRRHTRCSRDWSSDVCSSDLVCAAALAIEAELLWRSQSPRTSMAGTLGNTTNWSLRKLRGARIGDFRFFEASKAKRKKGEMRGKWSIRAGVVWTVTGGVLQRG